jgi:hypothetical protein
MTPRTSPCTQRSCISAGRARNSVWCDTSRAPDQRINKAPSVRTSVPITLVVSVWPPRRPRRPRPAEPFAARSTAADYVTVVKGRTPADFVMVVKGRTPADFVMVVTGRTPTDYVIVVTPMTLFPQRCHNDDVRARAARSAAAAGDDRHRADGHRTVGRAQGGRAPGADGHRADRHRGGRQPRLAAQGLHTA